MSRPRRQEFIILIISYFFQLSEFVHMLFDIRSEFPKTHSLPRHDKAKYIN
jgi:hypothetical protein